MFSTTAQALTKHHSMAKGAIGPCGLLITVPVKVIRLKRNTQGHVTCPLRPRQ